MLRPSQVRMYRDVHIYQPRHFESFARTLLGNRDLSVLVKKLIADVGMAWSSVLELPGDEFPLSSQAIHCMPNLQALTIIGLSPNLFDPDQAMSSPVLERFLGAFAASCPKLKSLRLQQLELQEYAHLVQYIVAFCALETLELDSVTWTRRGKLRATERGIPDGTCAKLHNLNISMCDTHRRQVWNFALAASWGSSIQQLVLRVPRAALKEHEFKGLSTFSRLRHFELHLADDDICGVPPALRHITSEAIKTVRIVHHCQMRDNVLELYARLDLDGILVVPPYTFLEKVTWRLVSERREAEDWFQGIPQCFPGLAKREILVCELRKLSEWLC
ncbi:hypothetical protein C8T65DRAFT_72922 [Cerioporus squamosus]|nr:hypothetical protein C8T65DRAFT_72922 [Cerioporus squamosus]